MHTTVYIQEALNGYILNITTPTASFSYVVKDLPELYQALSQYLKPQQATVAATTSHQ